MQKRGWLEITASILGSLEEHKLKKTHLTNKANIDTRAASKYVSFLLSKHLIARSKEDSLYEITEKGRVFMKSYRSILEMLQIETLSINYSVFENVR